MKKIHIGLLGCGTVGTGVAKLLLENKELLDPRVLIEDELLLAMPQIPMHPESEIDKACQIELDYPK